MATYNNFKSTTIRGEFRNSDSSDGSILANAIIDRNLSVKGDIILDANVSIKTSETTYSTIPATQLLNSSGTLEIIDQFVQFYDQFTPGSVYEWAFL